jgi:hypothetical protein
MGAVEYILLGIMVLTAVIILADDGKLDRNKK